LRLLLVAAGTRLPDWVNRGFEEYVGRLAGEYRLELREIALGQRSAGAAQQAIAREGERMLSALPPSCFVVALQVDGRSLSSEQLAKFLETRAQDGRDVAFCIGGPDGLAPQINQRAGRCQR
jgi:23S rRNA (pseudouridine1915-N3)-methyltransferase